MNGKMSYYKLKGFLAEQGIKHSKVAKILGISQTTFSKKINRNNADFNADEIRVICRTYNISSDEFFLTY
ncbi:helix-turn-helix transcriptional regulator [Helcococcus bovis]|uniref:helix-turn-helix domain-containing protein n=1 Tax=Helcococcus bovis TaxID=3153252 RepID=UPI0038B897CD